jgi:hypothetical protein
LGEARGSGCGFTHGSEDKAWFGNAVLQFETAKDREVDIAQVVAVRHGDAIVVAMNRGCGA